MILMRTVDSVSYDAYEFRAGANIGGGVMHPPHLFQMLVFYCIDPPPANELTPYLQIRGAALAYYPCSQNQSSARQ